jgi:palmitoyltransferase ZDHHC1/11
MSKFEDGFTDAPARTADLEDANLPEKVDDATEANSPTSTCRSSLNGRSNRAGLTVGDANINRSSQLPRSSRRCFLGGFICALFIKADCRKFDDSVNQVDGEDALFCTICNAEVFPFDWLFSVSTT